MNEALALADWLDTSSNGPLDSRHKAAALLRTQHAEIEADNRNLGQLTDDLIACRREIARKDALLRQAFDALRQCEFTVPPAQRPIVKDALAAIKKEPQ